MLRVAVLLEQVLGPVPGGTGRYAREVAAALAEQAPPGAEVRLDGVAPGRRRRAACPGWPVRTGCRCRAGR